MLNQKQPAPWLFILGDHDVGKSYLISKFQSVKEPASFPTFGYEYSVIQQANGSFLHVAQFTDSSASNKIFTSLYQKHYSHACLFIVFNICEQSTISNTIDKFIKPILEIDVPNAPKLRPFYEIASSEGPILIPSDVMTIETILPIFFIASFADQISQNELDSYLKLPRDIAMKYGAGTAANNSPSLLPVCVSYALRKPLTPELREKICQLEDYFVPPGWDTPEKTAEIESPTVQEQNFSKNDDDVVSVTDWQSFLQELKGIGREEKSISSLIDDDDF